MALSLPVFGTSTNELLAPMIPRVSHKLPVAKRLSGQTVVFSLEWHRVDSAQPASLKHVCDDSEGVFGVLLESESRDSELVLGVAAKTSNAKGWVCAASVAAKLYENALIVMPVNEHQYWLLALSGGVPVPGKEIIVSLAEAALIANDLLSAYEFECVGDRAFWTDHAPRSTFTPLSIDELFSRERIASASTLRIYRTNHAPKLVIVGALISVLALGYGYRYEATRWIEDTFTERGERDRIAALTAQVQSQNAQSVERFNQVASNYPLDHWIIRLGSTLDRLRLTARGWNLTQLECGTGLPYCLATWTNSGKGTYAGLKASIAGAGELAIESPQTAKQTVPIERYQSTQFNTSEVTAQVHALPSQEQLLEQHFSLLQALTIIPSVNAGMDIKSQETVGYAMDLPNSVSLEPIQPFQIGSWKLEGDGLRVLMGSLQKMDPQVFFGESLTITINLDQAGVVNTHWAVKGKYVAKTI